MQRSKFIFNRMITTGKTKFRKILDALDINNILGILFLKKESYI